MRNSMRRSGGSAGVALDHAVLHLDGAAHGVDHAAELDESSVAGALDDAPVMHGDGRIDQIAAQRPQPRQGAILVRAGEPAVADHIRDQDRRNFSGLAHSAQSPSQTSKDPPEKPHLDIERIQPKEGNPEPAAECPQWVSVTSWATCDVGNWAQTRSPGTSALARLVGVERTSVRGAERTRMFCIEPRSGPDVNRAGGVASRGELAHVS